MRGIAAHCRLAERAVQEIIADPEQDGYLSPTREGRGNTYRIDPTSPLRHPAEANLGVTVASLLSLLAQDEAHRMGPSTERAAAPA
ncbi:MULTISPECIES: MarR family transcriptional regulator [unclassified Streptomyces]|uniref:MarR family transcriptional regulator n=1 Tax=unclassified Streptomyces TaxID=2593676 RepID=UPI00368E5B20